MNLKSTLVNTNVDNIRWNLLTPENDNSNLTPIFFLHGFAGQADDWSFLFKKVLDLNFYPIAIDLIGHGKSDKPDDKNLYTEESLILQLHNVIHKICLGKFILCGYSLGGRLALSYASTYNLNIKALILESATPGINEPQSQIERVNNDKLLAKKIKDEGVEKFFEFWYNIPLFQSLKLQNEIVLSNLIKKRTNNSVIGLSNMMVGFSQGNMSSKWKLLHNINSKTLLLSGSLDSKFTNINSQMNELLKYSTYYIIDKAGHIPHLENPSLFENYLLNFLETIK